jgi:hypothetical protein
LFEEVSELGVIKEEKAPEVVGKFNSDMLIDVQSYYILDPIADDSIAQSQRSFTFPGVSLIDHIRSEIVLEIPLQNCSR